MAAMEQPRRTVVSDDDTEREPQDRVEDSSSRPATAAARRGRRGAGSRPTYRADTSDTADAGATDTKDRKGRPTPAGRRDERVSPIGRMVRFLREVVAELRKVIWPTRKELVTYTAVVLVFVSFMVALIALLDIAFAKGVLWLFG
jgi:preprotein translocase subunit SecE